MLRRPRGLVRGTGTRGSDPWRRDANRDIARHPDRADTACADGRRRGGHTAASRLDRVGTPWKSYQTRLVA